jgi:ribosomal subunit interface protein
MTSLTTLPWNLVTKNLQVDGLLRKKLRQKITKLEKQLKHFPPDTVHLLVVLERQPKKPLHAAALTLRVPSNILHSEKSAPDVPKAFDDAVKALLRELESLKSDLRAETFWKRKARRKELHQLKATRFADEPQTEGTGPQKYRDVVRELFQRHYKELLRHARRHIGHDELAGEIPTNALEARDLVDEVARRAMTKAAERPKGMDSLIWFYHLIHEELKRQRRLLKHKKTQEVSIDEIKALPEDAVRTEGLVPDPQAVPSDEVASQKDVLAQLQQDMRNWPRPEREVFELYFVEGLEGEEIAMVTGRLLKTVRESIASIQQRLREEMLEKALV